jgi:hypothetical protein
MNLIGALGNIVYNIQRNLKQEGGIMDKLVSIYK